MNTFICEYNILSDQNTRDTCLTLFGSMTVEDDKKELKEVILLGRWSCVGESKGFCVVQSKCVESVQTWLINWIPMADIKITPCLDDNDHRRLILKEDPEYLVDYKNIDSGPKDGESLYFIKYQFKDNKKNEGFKIFASLSQEDDKKDSGTCTSYGRWHVPSLGYGFAIASSPSVLDIYKWAYNWNDLCDVNILPVTEDITTRNIIKNSLGFDLKLKMLKRKMSKMIKKKSFCF